MHRIRRFLPLASVSMALLLAGCADQSASQDAAAATTAQMPAPTVAVVTAASSSVTIWDELPARVSALRVANIRAQVGGLILKRLFEEGAIVKEGQPLFEIDPASFAADVAVAEAALKKANAALAKANADLERSRALLEGNNISQQNFDQVESAYAQAEADVAQAQATLQKSHISLRLATVTAPIAGQIGAAMVSEGTLADPAGATALATIQQIDSVYVDIRQPSSRLEQIRNMAKSGTLEATQGIPVEIFVGGDDAPISATALFSDITVDESTGNVRMRAVAENQDRRLLPGMFVRARVPRGTYADALLVPQQAVVRDLSGQSSLYIVGEDGVATPRPVVVGELVDGQYIVQSGLEAGERLVVEGQDKLMGPGPVEAVEWSPPAQDTQAPAA